MATLNNLQQAGADKAEEVSKKTHDLAQKTSAAAKEKGQQMYEQAQSGLQKAAVVATAGGALLQGLMDYNEKRARKNLHKAMRKTRHLQDTVQPALQDAWPRVQGLLQDELEATQHVLKEGLESAHDVWHKRSDQAQKNLKHMQKAAQKGLGSGWSKAQDSLETGWSATQDMLEERSEQIQKNLARVSSKKRELDEALQRRHERHQRKQARARSLFRWGLVSGLILALLFTPLSGAETRQRIAAFWNQYKQNLARNRSLSGGPAANVPDVGEE